MLDVSIVIVSWNVKDLLRKCLQSVFRETEVLARQEKYAEIFVVDNDSSDGTLDMVRKEFPEVKVIHAPNNGFSAGNNVALRQVSGKYILLLNPDTEFQPNTLLRMMSFFETHSDAGLIGPKILLPNGELQMEAARRFPTLLDQFFLYTFVFRYFFPKSKFFNRYLMGDFDRKSTKEVDMVLGACMMFTNEVFRKVGLWDEQFFLCGEDMDYCKRVKDAGWKIFYVAEASILHHSNQSMKKVWQKSLLEGMISDHKYYRKHSGVFTAMLYRSMITLFFLLWAFAEEYGRGRFSGVRKNFKNIFQFFGLVLQWKSLFVRPS